MGPLAEELYFVMDFEWWLRFNLLFGFEAFLPVDALLCRFRHHSGAKTSRANKVNIRERYSIFRRLALDAEEPQRAAFLAAEAPEPVSEDYKLRLPALPARTALQTALAWFLYHQARMLYEELDLSKAMRFFRQIDETRLGPEGRREMRKYRARCRYLPERALRLGRRMRGRPAD